MPKGEMVMLSKDQILKADDSKTIEVDVPEWGGTVLVGTMSGFARDQFESAIIGKNGGLNTTNIRAKLAASTLIDAKGNLLFNDKDVAALGKKSAAALDRVFEEAQKLNRISEADVEDLAKNS